MPTGYTADIKDGTVTDFRTFAMRCARAFGACIMQRDDDMRDAPKHREKSDFYEKLLKESTARLKELLSMTVEQATVLEEADRKKAAEDVARMHRERSETKDRYEAMLAKVKAWKPPTGMHTGLRDFMIQQLTESISFDCSDLSRYMPSAEPQDPQRWLESHIEKERKNVERYAAEATKEEARVAEANAWIDALFASLPEEP